MSDSKLVQERFIYSQNDLTSAYHLFYDLYPKQSEIACYLSQQCSLKSDRLQNLQTLLLHPEIIFVLEDDGRFKILTSVILHPGRSFQTNTSK
jgi:hypothetical protein